MQQACNHDRHDLYLLCCFIVSVDLFFDIQCQQVPKLQVVAIQIKQTDQYIYIYIYIFKICVDTYIYIYICIVSLFFVFS